MNLAQEHKHFVDIGDVEPVDLSQSLREIEYKRVKFIDNWEDDSLVSYCDDQIK
jgi:hypothetical protein